MLILSIVILLIISFLLALNSLRNELKKPKEIKHVEKELMKEKILFVRDSDSTS